MGGIKIEEAELRVVRLPLLKPFTISTGTMHDKIFPLLILRGEGLEGYAESVVDPFPIISKRRLRVAWNFCVKSISLKFWERDLRIRTRLIPSSRRGAVIT